MKQFIFIQQSVAGIDGQLTSRKFWYQSRNSVYNIIFLILYECTLHTVVELEIKKLTLNLTDLL